MDPSSGSSSGHRPPSDEQPSEDSLAEDVWFGALGEHKDGTPDLEELCRAHPDIAGALRRVHGDWHWLEGRLEDSDASASGELLNRLDPQRYTTLEQLAEGGGGRVDRIWDALLRRSLAMKVSRVRGRPDELARHRPVSRFLREARVTGQLQHPGIVPVHDVGIDDDGFAYFTMNLVEGMDLGDAFALAREGREGWSTGRAVRALASVADTIAYAHSRGVLHRDLKPANVRVGPFGEVYVMDWGLARFVEDELEEHIVAQEPAPTDGLRTVEGAVLGTPAYMPPEQARGAHADLDARADVYAVGTLLYELLAGRAPYADRRSTTPEEMARDVVRGAPEPLASAALGAPPELIAICERAMARNRDERYTEVAALGADLRAYLEGRVVRAHRTGTVVEIEKWVRRNRLTTLVLGLLVVALSIAAWIQYDGSETLKGVNLDLDAARIRAQGETHFARLAAAQAGLRADLPRAAAAQVEACDPDSRGWAWRHVHSRVTQVESSTPIDLGYAAPGSFDRSDDGRFALGQSLVVPHLQPGRESANDLVLYDIEQGTQTVLGPIPGALQLRFLPGTHHCIVRTRTRLSIHDCDRGGEVVREQEIVSSEAEALVLAVTQDGRRVVVTNEDSAFEVWTTSDLERVSVFVPNPVVPSTRAMAVSADGSALACLDMSGTLHHVDVMSGAARPIGTASANSSGNAPCLLFTPDGAELVVGGSDGDVRMIDLATAQVVARYDITEDAILALAYDDRERWLLCGARDGTVTVVEFETGERLFRGAGHRGMVVAAGWSKDEGRFWSASRDGTLCNWDAARGNGFDLLRTGRNGDLAHAVDPDRPRIATLGIAGSLVLWDTVTGDPVARQDAILLDQFAPIQAVFLPSDGDLLVSTRFSGLLRLDANTLDVVDAGGASGGARMTLSADGKWVGFARKNGARITKVDDLDAERVLEGVLHPTGFHFLSDGSAVWVAEPSGRLGLWSLTGDVPQLLHSVEVPGGLFGLAGRGSQLAVGTGDGRVELRRASDGALLHVLGTGVGRVERLDFHPSEPILVTSGTGSISDESLRIWDLGALQLRCEILGPAGRLIDARFTAGGKTLAVRSASRPEVILIDDGPRSRGTNLVRARADRLKRRYEHHASAWPHPRASLLAWNELPDLDEIGRRAGRLLAHGHWASERHSVLRLAELEADPDTLLRNLDPSGELARFVAQRGKSAESRLLGVRVLVRIGALEDARRALTALTQVYPRPSASLAAKFEALELEIEAGLGPDTGDER